MVVKLYVEGGGDSDRLHRRCREGFQGFLEKAGFKGNMPRIVACGGRQKAYDRFRTACSANETALLLIDSEEKVCVSSPWAHLQKEKFDAPVSAGDVHCHLMVVCMESWFLADKEVLSQFFGQGFNAGALPRGENVETISKHEVYEGLQRASLHCKTKSPYGKGEHSFMLLLKVDPEKVAAASPWAARFLKELKQIMQEAGR